MRELKGVVPNQTAISCTSEELAKQVHIILKECGYVWRDGSVLVEDLRYMYNVHYHIYDKRSSYITYSSESNGKTVITAEEFIKINSNMKNLTKEEVYVSITSDEEAVKLRDLLQKAGETIYTDSRLLFGEEDSYFDQVYYSEKVWMYTKTLDDRTEVTLEQLAEILGVKQQFKVGDRVRCKSGFSNQYGSNYGGAGYVDGIQFEISYINSHSSVDKIGYFNADYEHGVFGKALELVEAGKETTIETVTISRANLGRLYPIVCSSWQLYINSLLDDAGSFAVEVQVPLERLKQAYSAADYRQKAILIEVAPLPKVKSTVKVSRWVNIYEETASILGTTGGVGNTLFTTKEDANRNKAQIGYIDTIELTGEYTTEVEDPLLNF